MEGLDLLIAEVYFDWLEAGDWCWWDCLGVWVKQVVLEVYHFSFGFSLDCLVYQSLSTL